MPGFTLQFLDKQRPQEGPVAEFIIDRPTAREALALATSLFVERYPERGLSGYEVRIYEPPKN